ncbi:hypothetical protein Ciccas_010205, partial [Cichlidogyrus casuarinus]
QVLNFVHPSLIFMSVPPCKMPKLSEANQFTIKIDNQCVRVDKSKLLEESNYFKALIQHEESNSNAPINEIILSDVPHEAVQSLIDFINTKTIKLDQTNILRNYTYGDFFCDENLLAECRKFLVEKLDRLCEPNPELLKISVLIVSRLVDDNLTDHICSILAKNPEHFVKYIQEVGFSKFSRTITKCQMILRDNEFLYMGNEYYKKLKIFYNETFPEHKSEIEAILENPPKSYQDQLNFVVPWALQEHEKAFGSGASLKVQNVYSIRFSTCGSLYDPADWVLSGMRFYFLKLYGNKYRGRGLRPVAGIDVFYRNVWTGHEVNSACHLQHSGAKYAKTEFRLEKGETIKRVIIIADYRVESIEFLTSQGRQLGPFGRARATDKPSTKYAVDPPQLPARGFKAPEKLNYPPFVPSQLKKALDQPTSNAREEEQRPRHGLCTLTQRIQNAVVVPPAAAEPQNRQEEEPENMAVEANGDNEAAEVVEDVEVDVEDEDEVHGPLEPSAQVHADRVTFQLPYHFCPTKPREVLNMSGYALHGFSYHLCLQRKRLHWNQIRLIFSGVPQEIARTHRPLRLENLNLCLS